MRALKTFKTAIQNFFHTYCFKLFFCFYYFITALVTILSYKKKLLFLFTFSPKLAFPPDVEDKKCTDG